MPCPKVPVHYTEHAYPISIWSRNYADALTLAAAHDITLIRALSHHTNPRLFLLYRKKQIRVPPPVPLPKLLLTVHTTVYASFTIDLSHDDAGHWPEPLPKVLSTKRSSLSPSRDSYRKYAGSLALASAETLHPRNTKTTLIESYPYRGFQLCTPLVQKFRGHLGLYLPRNCTILTSLFTRHKLNRASADDLSVHHS